MALKDFKMVNLRFWENGYNQNIRLASLMEKYKKRKLSIFIIGAGALANFVAIGLSQLKLGKITIFDKDKIEETNLNRQVLYFDAVGQPKANILKKRLKELNSRNIYNFELKFFDYISTKKYFRWFGEKPDILIDCVDNFETRAFLNRIAAKYKIPLISGGTSPLAGQVMLYFPGITSCLNCELDIERLAEERERRRQGCTEVPEGSVVTTNQIIGGMMVGELHRLLNGIPPTSGTIKYISSDDDRVGFVPNGKACNCHLNSIKIESKKSQLSVPLLDRLKSFFVEEEV